MCYLLALALLLITTVANAQGLLPNAKQTFLDANGNPLAGGFVYFYVPGTTTLKATWSNPTETMLNTNPVVLDAAGRATIYGTGQYREVVKDSLGNTVWDQLTQAPGFIPTNISYNFIVNTNADLKALSADNVSNVARCGFYAAGDAPCLNYTPSNSACSLNAGNGDNGSQVKSVDNRCWIATWNSNGMDARQWGATCDTSDSTAAIQAAVSAAGNTAIVKGGTIVIPCPMTVATGNILIPGAVHLTGGGPLWYANMFVSGGGGTGGASWPATAGPAINCTSVSNTCFVANGLGIEVDHINFGNTQPVPSGGSWTPTSYPFILSSQCPTSTGGVGGGFNFHDLTFTSTSKAIDIEGCADYTTGPGWSTTQIKIENIWCNPCIENGIKLHRLDQASSISHVFFSPLWEIGNPNNYQPYLLAHSIGIDIQYAAQPVFTDIQFFLNKIGVRIANDTVVNGFGTLILGCQTCNFSQIYFNQVCQAVVTNDTDKSTRVNMSLVNVEIWGDQNSSCSANLPMFDMPTNVLTFQIDNVGLNAAVDTFGSFGCGTPGAGSCPVGASTIQPALVQLGKIHGAYAALGTHNQPFVKAPSNAIVVFDAGIPFTINNSNGTGVVNAAGTDGTTSYPRGLMGGGAAFATAAEGGVNLAGGGALGNPTKTGTVAFTTPDGTRRGFAGFGDSTGINLKADGTGSVVVGNDSVPAVFGASGGALDPVFSGLKNAATGTLLGSICIDNTGHIFYKNGVNCF